MAGIFPCSKDEMTHSLVSQGCIKLGLVRVGAGVREVSPFLSGGPSNPAGLVSENGSGTYPCRIDLKSLMQPCWYRGNTP